MNIRSQTVSSSSLRELTTEIMFFAACAKALNEEIFVVDIKPSSSPEADLRCTESVARILKDLKRKGVIQLFAASDDFDSSLMEIEYLKNKYPQIFDIKRDRIFFAVKL